MTKDSIFGMMVNEAKALRAERDGQTFYFCSEHCQKQFLAEIQPANVAKSNCGGGHENHAHGGATVKPSSAKKYFCPMCSGAESDKPGDCPKCDTSRWSRFILSTPVVLWAG